MKLRPFLECVDGFERLDEALLHCVLGVLVAPEQASRHREQTATMAAHEDFERRWIAALKARDERVVVNGRRRNQIRRRCAHGGGHHDQIARSVDLLGDKRRTPQVDVLEPT